MEPVSGHSTTARPVFLLLLSALALGTLLLTAGCGTADPGGAEGNGTAPTTAAEQTVLAASHLSRATAPAPRDDVLSASGSLGSFAADLYGVLAKEAGDSNLVFSPASVVTALVMTYAGAEGTTAEEMAATLHLGLEGDTLHQAFNSLDRILESRSWEGKDAEGKDVGVLVRTANSLWAQRDLAFQQPFLDTLALNYGAGVRLVDYKTEAERARRAINDWVAGQTEDKITDLIPEGALDALTRLVLVNAVYLDATWANQFDKALTTDGRFTTIGGDPVTTPMMRQSAGFPYAKGEGWQAVELPYLRDELSMIVIVPDEGGFAQVEGRLAEGLIAEVRALLSPGAEVDLSLPKFEFRTQAGLSDALRALGMQRAFDPQAADFSGMTEEEALFIDDVIHEAYIAVDEEGTEAAAATAVVMRATAMPAQQITLVVDRPFLFALQDRDTGALLFLGRVTDPTA
jgi:serpin B